MEIITWSEPRQALGVKTARVEATRPKWLLGDDRASPTSHAIRTITRTGFLARFDYLDQLLAPQPFDRRPGTTNFLFLEGTAPKNIDHCRKSPIVRIENTVGRQERIEVLKASPG